LDGVIRSHIQHREGVEVKKARPVLITAIAVLQIIPILILPPNVLRSINRVLLVLPLAIFAFLAWGLFTFQPVARTLTVFLHGMSITVRLLVTLARVVPSRQEGTPADVVLFVTSFLSIALSVLILYYVDKPDTQLLFEA
jgi:peptidoglycan/LPS O-acetylase OafA/YrhL